MSSVGNCNAGFWTARDAGASEDAGLKVVVMSPRRARFGDITHVVVAGLCEAENTGTRILGREVVQVQDKIICDGTTALLV